MRNRKAPRKVVGPRRHIEGKFFITRGRLSINFNVVYHLYKDCRYLRHVAKEVLEVDHKNKGKVCHLCKARDNKEKRAAKKGSAPE